MPWDCVGRPVTWDQWLEQFEKSWREHGLRFALRFHWWDVGSGSSAKVFAIPIYGLRDEEKGFLYHGVARPVYRTFNGLLRARIWLRSRIARDYQHHIVRTELRPGWHDVDEVMLHACFTLLRRYVEFEHGGVENLRRSAQDLRDPENQGELSSGGYNPPELMEQQASGDDEVVRLYDWWMVGRHETQRRHDELLRKCFGRRMRTEEVEIDAPGGPIRMHKVLPPDDGPFMEKLREEYYETRDRMYREEQESLEALVHMRGRLWT